MYSAVIIFYPISGFFFIPGPAMQSVGSQIADPGVVSLIPDRSKIFVEIDHEILSLAILLLR